MKRFAIWFPSVAVATVLLVAAAPSKKSSTTVSTPVENAAPQPAAIAPATPEITTDIVGQNAALPAPQIAPSTTAAAVQGGNYAIDWYSINGGGTVNATSASYKMGASIGQSVAGAASSPSYQMGIGFWYGAGGGGCACDCHADPACDGFTTILDVVEAVNTAFRNDPAAPDPNPSCPRETTDTDCNGFTDIIDVSHMVNVAFRNGNPATEFCNPCS